MGEQEVPVDEAHETLERLYDNPDEQIPELHEYRPDEETVEREYSVFQALANEDRLRLLEALRHGERCGCELMVILDAPQSTVATHLRSLRDAGLVKNRKKGRWNYYRIADAAVMDLLDLATVIQED
jgi:ArsR family transcriptional regulator